MRSWSRVERSRMWAGAELTEQLWGRLQVKDESSPTGRHQSLMEWHIWEGRQRETEGGQGGRRQQTHAWVLTLLRSRRVIAVQPRQTHPSAHEPSQAGGEGEGYDATHDNSLDRKHARVPETLVISWALSSFVSFISTYCQRLWACTCYYSENGS